MQEVFNSISTRETALIFWLIVIFCFTIGSKRTRQTAVKLLQFIFWSKLTVYFVLIALYTIGTTYLLSEMSLWNVSQLKNTLIWYFTVAAASLSDITNQQETNYFRSKLKEIVGLTAIVQFIVGVYCFHLAIELLIIPVAILLACVIVFAERTERNKPIAKYLKKFVSISGIFLAGYVIYKIIFDFKSFANRSTLEDFLLPAALTLLFLPGLYLLSVIITHNDVFQTAKGRIPKTLRLYARFKVLIAFHFNKIDLRRWEHMTFLRQVRNKEDIDNIIALINQMKRMEHHCKSVTFEKGWSPYKAKEFLKGHNIDTGFYQPTADDDEWMAISKSKKIENDNLGLNSLSYYVEGAVDVANQLTLELTVFNKDNDQTSLLDFITVANALYESSMQAVLPIAAETAIKSGGDYQWSAKNRIVSIRKREWLDHKLGGYNLNFTVKVNSVSTGSGVNVTLS
jgi:hypothetical protein